MNADVWKLLGRRKYKLNEKYPDICADVKFTKCPGHPPCSFHGTCDGKTGKCTCNAGYFGEDCSQYKCPGNPECNGKGVCVTTISPPVCNCNPSWKGLACDGINSLLTSH
jgi:hypothetical protein